MLENFPLENLQKMMPFNLILQGSRRSGKSYSTYRILKYLHGEKAFTRIMCFLGTAKCNQELINLLENYYDDRMVFEQFNSKIVNLICKQQERLYNEGRMEDICLCFDDAFVNEKNQQILSYLCTTGRHFGISTIICSVSYCIIPKNVRRSCDLLMMFSSVCKSDMDILLSEYVRSRKDLCVWALENLEQYCALVIETKRNQNLYKLKFKKKDFDSSEIKSDTPLRSDNHLETTHDSDNCIPNEEELIHTEDADGIHKNVESV